MILIIRKEKEKMYKKASLKNSFEAYFFILPAFVIYVIVVLKPLLNTIVLSFYEWDGASEKIFVFLKNYQKLFSDPIFLTALRNNLAWIVASIFIPMILGLLLAVLLWSIKNQRIRFLFQTSYFMPVIPSLIIVGIIWGWIYNPVFGAANKILKMIGLGALSRGWLGSPVWALPSVILAGNWTFFGFCMTIFLAGLQNIDKNLFEAAIIDGANRIQSFRYITIPSLRNQINLLIIYILIGSFKVFDIVYVMTKGGPFNSTEVVGTYMYTRAFEHSLVGYGSSMATILALIVSISTLIFLRLREEK
jgi:raffinose/stachyose/melibiose transport system permease protein